MADKTKPPEFDREASEDEAADWVVRLNDTEFDPDEPYPELEDRNQACLAWVLQSALHYGAFLRMYDAHCRLGGIDRKRQNDIEALLARAREEMANERWRANRARVRMARPPNSPPRHVYRLAAGVAALTLLGGAAYFAWRYLHPDRSLNETLVTKVGEVKEFKLADGSTVTLDTDSRAEVTITATYREVKLLRGGALFSVVHDSRRPFTTCAAGALLADVGTDYAVEIRDHGLDLNVIFGAVEFRGGCPSPVRANHEPTTPRQITAGQHASIDFLDSGPEIKDIQPRTPHQMNVTLACYRGVLILEDTSLSEALDQINRYLPRHLVLGDPVLYTYRFGGTVSISVLEKSILSDLKKTYKIIPDTRRSTASEVFLIPAPERSSGAPY